MGFQRHDDDVDHIEIDVPSGSAVLFNGALHRHAVLALMDHTAPPWWDFPFARAVFLLRDTRQSHRAMKRKQARDAAGRAAGLCAAQIALSKFQQPEISDEKSDGSAEKGKEEEGEFEGVDEHEMVEREEEEDSDEEKEFSLMQLRLSQSQGAM